MNLRPLAPHALHAGNAIFLRLVGEHGAGNAVADGIHSGSRRAKQMIYGDPAPLVGLDSYRFQADAVGSRPSAGGGQHPVTDNRLQPLAFHHAAAPLDAGPVYLDPQPNVQALLAEEAQGLTGDIAVDPGENAVCILKHRHLGPQAAPYAAEFQSDIAPANDHQMGGNGVVGERFSAGADDLAIHLDARQHHTLAAHRQHDLGRLQFGRRAVGGRHDDLASPCQTSRAPIPHHLILGEQTVDALAEDRDNVLLALHHHGQIECHRTDLHAVVGQFGAGFFVFMARFKQRLGGDAAHAEAGAAKPILALHHCCRHPQLCGADSSHIAPRAPADHHHIVLLRHRPTLWSESPAGMKIDAPEKHAQPPCSPALPCQTSSIRRLGSSTVSLIRLRKVTASRPSTTRWS